MVRKSKSLKSYTNVRRKIIIRNKSFNNCRELMTKHNIIRYEVINPLFLQYYNSKKNINITNDIINNNKIMNRLVNNKYQNNKYQKNKYLKNKYQKSLKNIKMTLDENLTLNSKNKELIIYTPPISKTNGKINTYVQINTFMKKINNQIITNAISNNSDNIFKSPMILRPRYKSKHNNDCLYEKLTPEKLIPEPPIIIKKEKVNIAREINNIKELLQLIEDYPIKPHIEYNINMEAIHRIKNPLIELNSMIGMNKLKQNIVDQILYFIQDLHKISQSKNNDFMHTVIYGPPGTGKTETAKIMGKIFSGLGVLKESKFKKVTRSDLIAGYLGQTALKTRDVIKESLGGVLFIDEAYALGNIEKRDSFAKECLDTLCEALSDHKDDLMVIIAGYKDELDKCFFSYNSGLSSRFTWRFKTDDYTYQELFLIFKKKVYDINWKLSDTITEKWFEHKKEDFKYYGRDIETFLSKAKICHSKRVFCLTTDKKTIITMKDLDRAFEIFKDNNSTEDKDVSKEILHHMYC